LTESAAKRPVREGPGEGSPPPRRLDVRVGSTPDALAPISIAERSLAAGPRQWGALGLVVVSALAADQLTKQLVSSQLALGDEVELAGPFSIHHVQNSGIAFGLFSSATAIVIALTGVAVAWMVAFFARSGARHPVLPVGLGLVLGGSLSNLADRVRLGHVTDFLDVRWWPAFNLADTFIVVGVLVLLATLVAADREPPRRARRRPPDAPSRAL
jgi:signal peptidase II